MNEKFTTIPNFNQVLKILFGTQTVIEGGTQRQYNKGDIMKYLSNGEYSFYRCKKQGQYSIPDNTNFKKVLM